MQDEPRKKETSRRFYTHQHPLYCGIDLHARRMYVCVLSHDGAMRLHRNRQAAPAPFLKAVAPYREGLVVAVECMFTWSWLADLCAQEGLPFVLGHALSMTAIHGGKAKNDTSDSHKMAALLRGGRLPEAYGYPADMRATRALLRRRTPLLRQRSELLSHVQTTTAQYNLAAIGKNIAYKANREGVAERFNDPAVHKPIAGDLALITYDEARLKARALYILKTAKQHAAPTLSLLQPVPGIGTLLSLVLLYAIHPLDRFPSVQEFASYARLVTGSKESAGNRGGTSGKKLGNAHLTWAFAEAAVLLLRNHEPGQKLLARLEKQQGQGKALSSLAHQLGRAVYYMLKRRTAFDLALFLKSSGSRAGEPNVSLDTKGMRRKGARGRSNATAFLNAQVCLGPVSPSPTR